MVGGPLAQAVAHTPRDNSEEAACIAFEFPRRPGALMAFVSALHPKLDVSNFPLQETRAPTSARSLWAFGGRWRTRNGLQAFPLWTGLPPLGRKNRQSAYALFSRATPPPDSRGGLSRNSCVSLAAGSCGEGPGVLRRARREPISPSPSSHWLPRAGAPHARRGPAASPSPCAARVGRRSLYAQRQADGQSASWLRSQAREQRRRVTRQ